MNNQILLQVYLQILQIKTRNKVMCLLINHELQLLKGSYIYTLKNTK